MMRKMILCVALAMLAFSCGRQEKSKTLQKITRKELANYIHSDYFKDVSFEANLEITRKDMEGIHRYAGRLKVNRADTSLLVIDRKPTFKFYYTGLTAATINEGEKPLLLDLTNPAHNIVVIREISVLEFNPFRYLGRFYDYYLNTMKKDTVEIIAKMNREPRRIGNIKIEVNPVSGFITDIYFYSISGDLGRHVTYRRPVKLNGIVLPGEIQIDFASKGTVIREIYRLIDIKMTAQ